MYLSDGGFSLDSLSDDVGLGSVMTVPAPQFAPVAKCRAFFPFHFAPRKQQEERGKRETTRPAYQLPRTTSTDKNRLETGSPVRRWPIVLCVCVCVCVLYQITLGQASIYRTTVYYYSDYLLLLLLTYYYHYFLISYSNPILTTTIHYDHHYYHHHHHHRHHHLHHHHHPWSRSISQVSQSNFRVFAFLCWTSPQPAQSSSSHTAESPAPLPLPLPHHLRPPLPPRSGYLQTSQFFNSFVCAQDPACMLCIRLPLTIPSPTDSTSPLPTSFPTTPIDSISACAIPSSLALFSDSSIRPGPNPA